MYKKVLVPLDGSALSECTLPHVKTLVKRGLVGEVTILNVYRVDIAPIGPGPRAFVRSVDLNAIKTEMSKASTDYLADVESRLGSDGIPVKKVSLEGDRPASAISDYAKENGIEMIVIATHGHTGLKKLMIGSVASAVLQESHIPVLLIRPESCPIE